MPKRSNALRRRRSKSAPRCARPMRSIGPRTESRRASAMRSCRCENRLPNRICCATTPHRSASSICSPTHARRSAASTTHIQSVRDFWIAKSALDTALLGSPSTTIEARNVMLTRRSLFSGVGAAVAAAAVGKAALAALPEIVSAARRRDAAAAAARQRPALSPGRHLERLDAALAHARRRQGVSPRGGTGDSRDRAGHAGESLGLQRAVARADDRSRGGRPRSHVRDQPPSRGHQHSLAWAASAQRHGRRLRAQSAVDQIRADVRVRVPRATRRDFHVSPACRRNDANGDGHDGILGDSPEGSPSSCESTAITCSC